MKETISYLNLTVSGFPFQKITNFRLSHTVNEHAQALVCGELEPSAAQDCVQRTDESTVVTITTTAGGQPSRLFCGCVKNLSMSNETEYSSVELTLSSVSSRLDVEKKNKTYQNTSKTYSQILTPNLSDIADLHMIVSDKAIGALIMQYNETDWEFAKRMASQLQAPIVTNVNSVRPQIYIGMPPSSRTLEVETNSFSSGSDAKAYQKASFAGGGAAMAQDFAQEQVKSYAYGFVGDFINKNGKKSLIKGVSARLTDGMLEMSYSLMTAGSSGGGAKGGSGGGGSLAGVAVPKTVNAQSSGKMMKGTVKAVSKDKVQVHLTDIDSGGYDASGSWWFPYSTAYSSSDGSGWYCMPEVGDEVRVFFPSGNESDAFAASSVCAVPPANPRHKSWKAPGGKQILLTDEGLYIICSEGKIYINLTEEKGIEIHSDKEINISSDTKVSINSGSEIRIIAENEITIGTEGAYLELTKETATLAAGSVLIN